MPAPLTTRVADLFPDAASGGRPCGTDPSFVCDTALDLSGGNEQIARIADVLIGTPLQLLGLIVIGFLARWVLHRMVDRVVARAERGVMPGRVSKLQGGRFAGLSQPAGNRSRRVQRARTMGSLLKSIVTGVVLTIVVIMGIAELGYPIGPLLASAGILGVAIGFGSQALVKDFLSGIFMIFEDQYGVGDEVDLGDAIGTVEAVGLRVTRVRDLNGTVWYMRNGEILRVGNMSQNWARTVLDIRVAYREDLARVHRVLADVAHDLWCDDDFKGRIIEEPSVWGVEDLATDGVVMRVAMKTAPLEQWAIAREMRQRIKGRFDFEQIEIPYPQIGIWNREEQAAQPATGPQESAPAAGGAGRAEGPA